MYHKAINNDLLLDLLIFVQIALRLVDIKSPRIGETRLFYT